MFVILQMMTDIGREFYQEMFHDVDNFLGRMIGAINAHTADDIMISGVSLHQNNILQFL